MYKINYINTPLQNSKYIIKKKLRLYLIENYVSIMFCLHILIFGSTSKTTLYASNQDKIYLNIKSPPQFNCVINIVTISRILMLSSPQQSNRSYNPLYICHNFVMLLVLHIITTCLDR